MKKTNLKYVLGLVFTSMMAIAAIASFTYQVVDATSATSYTKTKNADNQIIRCQDGYLPETTYDRIGLEKPQDMVIDTVMEGGKEVEYGYILDSGNATSGNGPFILKFNLDDVANTVEKIELKGNLPYVSSPTGLWIQTTTVDGITRKEMYIADGAASYTETFTATSEDKALYINDYSYTYKALVYRVQFDASGNDLQLNDYTIIHEPVQEVSRSDYDLYEIISIDETEGRQLIPTSSNFNAKNDKGQEVRAVACKIGAECTDRIVPLGQLVMKTASFGQDTVFNPKKVAVDSSGNMFLASSGTSSGMIELSYSGEFVSFFVVNSVNYNFLYQFVKKYGTSEQLEKLDASLPQSFFNVFVDENDLVYSVTKNISTVFDKYSTSGSSILENAVTFGSSDTLDFTDCYITKEGLMYLTESSGLIYVFAPDGSLIFYFGSTESSTDIVGFFSNLEAICVDSKNRIWAIDSSKGYLQTFTPTDYANSIFEAIVSFNNHDYEKSRSAWEEVLKYDSLSVLANNGLGKAYYYEMNFKDSLKYFTTSKNRTLYSNVFWELRNDFLQENLSWIMMILIFVGLIGALLAYLFKTNKKFIAAKQKTAKIKDYRWFKDLTVGFRLITKPNDTFYEMKTNRRGSMLGATIYYILGIIAFMLNTYSYALPFQIITTNTLNPSTVLAGVVAVLGVFVLCNYLVSAINDGEGTFKDIYKFTGYSLLPMIICLPLAVGISYSLTLNEEVILTILKGLGFWGTGIILVIGILETHNYTFGQTVKNILLTIVFMILFFIICMVVFIMVDQIATFIETVWKEVKLRAGWY